MVIGDWISLHRDVSGVHTLEQSSNNGVNWSVLHTFSHTSTADEWVVLDIYGTSGGVPSTLVNALGENLV